MAWQFVGVSSVAPSTTGSHTLVTTGIAGTLQAGDLLIACISSRIASTASITLPTGGEWTLVSEQKNNNVATDTTATPSALMAYCVRGASNPNLTFTHPINPSIALGRIIAYRDVNQSSPKDTQSAAKTATATTAVSVAGLTTTQADDLIVAMCAGGQEAAWSAFNATDPAGASSTGIQTGAPTTTWLERIESVTTTGADTSLAIFDAVKVSAGATGNFTVTASISAAHVVIAGAFRIAAPSGTGALAAQAAALVPSAGVSSSTSAGTALVAQAPTLSALDALSSSASVTAALASAVAALAGTGTMVDAPVTGIGALVDNIATVTSAGVGSSTGTGILAAAIATVAGTGDASSTGTGALAGDVAAMTSDGTAASAGTGALADDVATMAGTGDAASTGTGALADDVASLTGTGVVQSADSGVLVVDTATVTGVGITSSDVTSLLAGTDASMTGIGQSSEIEDEDVTGTGALVAAQAVMTGLASSSGIIVYPPLPRTGRGIRHVETYVRRRY